MARSKQKGSVYIRAVEAAPVVGMSRERLIRLIQTGRVAGNRHPQFGWFVELDALEALAPGSRERFARQLGEHFGLYPEAGLPRLSAGGGHDDDL